ncbi:MAG: thioredoxin [Clostridia bacterium]|nr:thioredoxin [Clostridia bacterium]
MSVIKLTSENFDKEIKQYAGVALIDFYADWCGPCKMVSPVVDEIAETQSTYKICKVNVDDEADLAADFSVMSIPTLVVMKNGEIADTHIGLASKAKILGMLENAK